MAKTISVNISPAMYDAATDAVKKISRKLTKEGDKEINEPTFPTLEEWVTQLINDSLSQMVAMNPPAEMKAMLDQADALRRQAKDLFKAEVKVG